jgi:hypothetical protein
VNVEQKVATLEALLVRVKRNAAEARPARALHVVANDEAGHGSGIEDAATELPPELAHAVLPAPASSRTPAVAASAPSPKPPPTVESPRPPSMAGAPDPLRGPSAEPEPESKPRLVALAPPLASASRVPARSPTPTYGVPAQREAAKPAPSPKPAPVQESPKPAATRPITPQTPPVVAKPPTPAVAAKPAPSRVQPAPRTAAPVAKADATVRAKDAAATGPAHERSGAKTLMGTGLDEMRKALAQLDSKAPAPPTSPSAQPAMLGAEKISDDTTGEGATLVRSSPFDTSGLGQSPLAQQNLVEEASTEDEQTVLIPQPTQEELIAASERGSRTTRRQAREEVARAVEDDSGEGETLVKDSPFAVAQSDAPRGTLPMGEPEPPTLAKPQISPAPKVGQMGTMMMPPTPGAPAAASPQAPPPPEAPAPTAGRLGGTAIMEHALAATVPSEPPAAPPPEPMPGPMATPMRTSRPDNALAVGPSGPEVAQPSFLRDGPVYEAPLPARKKKSRAPMLGIGVAAAALVAAGAWLSLRNGWIDELIGSATSRKPTPSASATTSASAAVSAAPSAVESASATPEPATAAPTASAAPAASASAAASAAPSAKPAAGSGDASALPKNKGILMVTASQPGIVYVNGKFIGNAGEPLTVDCGIKYIRLAEPGAAPGKPPTFVGHGRPLKIGCQKTTEAALPAPPGLDGPARSPDDTPAPGGNPAPDL